MEAIILSANFRKLTRTMSTHERISVLIFLVGKYNIDVMKIGEKIGE